MRAPFDSGMAGDVQDVLHGEAVVGDVISRVAEDAPEGVKEPGAEHAALSIRIPRCVKFFEPSVIHFQKCTRFQKTSHLPVPLFRVGVVGQEVLRDASGAGLCQKAKHVFFKLWPRKIERWGVIWRRVHGWSSARSFTAFNASSLRLSKRVSESLAAAHSEGAGA